MYSIYHFFISILDYFIANISNSSKNMQISRFLAGCCSAWMSIIFPVFCGTPRGMPPRQRRHGIYAAPMIQYMG
jgi:hypothetical protein